MVKVKSAILGMPGLRDARDVAALLQGGSRTPRRGAGCACGSSAVRPQMTLATYAHVLRELKGLPALAAAAQVEAARQPRRRQVDHAVQLELLRDEPRAQKACNRGKLGSSKNLSSTTVSTSAAAPSSRPRR